MESLTRDLVARKLPAKNLASLSLASKEWQRAAQPHLDTRRALVRVADVRRRKAIERLVQMLDRGFSMMLSTGPMPESWVVNGDWHRVRRYNMTLYVNRHRLDNPDETLIVEVQAPRLGVVLQLWLEGWGFRAVLRHDADSDDTARAVADAWRASHVHITRLPLQMPLQMPLHGADTSRPRRGDPRA